MTKHELKLLGVAGLAIVLLAASLFAMPWFLISLDATGLAGLPEGAATSLVVEVDLNSASACQAGSCLTIELGKVSRGGAYVWFGGMALWLGRALLIAVAVQAGVRVVTKSPIAILSRLGMLAAGLTFVCGFLAAYVFGSTGSEAAMGIGVAVSRTWAPAMLLLGAACSIATLYLAQIEVSIDDVDLPVRVPPPAAPAPPAAEPPPSEPEGSDMRYGTPNRPRRQSRMPSSIPLDDEPAPRPRTPSSIPLDGEPAPTSTRAAGEIVEIDRRPRNATGQIDSLVHGSAALVAPPPIQYVVTTIQLSAEGFDATREHGERCRVAWGDVVGIVARRLPPETPYGGIAVVDVISTPGATVRITPATRVVGASLRGVSPEDDARTFAKLALQRSPDARLDAATRTFLEGKTPLAEIPDVATLAEHDRRLA